jgi:CubicO group peptidase (beta-lactamase class C family)
LSFKRKVPTLKTTAVVALAAVSLARGAEAQSLSFALFERYLESLRQESAIPGLSAAIVQGGHIAWEGGFGHRDVEGSIRAEPDTPYPIVDLAQTFASTLLLQQCLERRDLQIDDRMVRWAPNYPEPSTTVGQLLAHASPSGSFKYDPSRYAALTEVVQQCGSSPYRRIVAQEILDRLGMVDSVPGHHLAEPSAADRRMFDQQVLDRYAAVIRRMAVPYKVDSRGRPARSDYPNRTMDASTGLISTVRDLARYDAALDDGDLIRHETLALAWSNARSPSGGTLPTGRGWFVQTYNGERIVWHFGAAEAFSSLIVKVPGRNLTLILLANSDGLSARFALDSGDVTSSLFARLFLRLFIG